MFTLTIIFLSSIQNTTTIEYMQTYIRVYKDSVRPIYTNNPSIVEYIMKFKNLGDSILFDDFIYYLFYNTFLHENKIYENIFL